MTLTVQPKIRCNRGPSFSKNAGRSATALEQYRTVAPRGDSTELVPGVDRPKIPGFVDHFPGKTMAENHIDLFFWPTLW